MPRLFVELGLESANPSESATEMALLGGVVETGERDAESEGSVPLAEAG
jgi:hypothetical protein